MKTGAEPFIEVANETQIPLNSAKKYSKLDRQSQRRREETVRSMPRKQGGGKACAHDEDQAEGFGLLPEPLKIRLYLGIDIRRFPLIL